MIICTNNLILALTSFLLVSSSSNAQTIYQKEEGTRATDGSRYEIWASDQSNSVPDASSTGINGSYIWIWDSDDVHAQLKDPTKEAVPKSCTPPSYNNNNKDEDASSSSIGPCNLWDVFPPHLEERNADDALTGSKLEDLSMFGRLHGMLKDPQNRYVTANMYAPGMFVLPK